MEPIKVEHKKTDSGLIFNNIKNGVVFERDNEYWVKVSCDTALSLTKWKDWLFRGY